MLRVYLLPALLVAFATVAPAQTIVVNPARQPAPMTAEPVRISVNVNTFVATLTEDSEQSLKAQEAGRRMIYELAGNECAVLRDVLASECRLESINVNFQRVAGNQYNNQQRTEGFNINGSISFRILPK